VAGRRDSVNYEGLEDGSYPLTRRLFVIVRKDGLVDEQAGLAYANLLLSQEGQALVEQAGFMRLY
jgi:phosphate transport system substrate-binding protein